MKTALLEREGDGTMRHETGAPRGSASRASQGPSGKGRCPLSPGEEQERGGLEIRNSKAATGRRTP